MHDPMVVAWEVPAPIPRRYKFDDHKWGGRSGIERRRGTGAQNLGRPIYRWWRPAGYRVAVRGRAFRLRRLVTIWHVEPNGADTGTICKHWVAGKHKTAWKWHIHHWHLQVPILQQIRRYLFERCELCGRRYPWNYAPISHQWDRQRDGHWWNITKGAYHHECSSLVHLRTTVETDVTAFRELVSMARLFEDLTEDEWVNRHLWGNQGTDFHVRRRVWTALGYEYVDGAGRLVKVEGDSHG